MKIRKNYVLVVNPLLDTATYKRKSSVWDTHTDSIVDVWDCNLSDLKFNLKSLMNRGYTIFKQK